MCVCVCVCVCVESAADEARCDSAQTPSEFAKTACQSDGHVERAVPGWTAWIRRTQDHSLPCRLVIREGSPPAPEDNMMKLN